MTGAAAQKISTKSAGSHVNSAFLASKIEAQQVKYSMQNPVKTQWRNDTPQVLLAPYLPVPAKVKKGKVSRSMREILEVVRALQPAMIADMKKLQPDRTMGAIRMVVQKAAKRGFLVPDHAELNGRPKRWSLA